jgi:hypothetical protein
MKRYDYRIIIGLALILGGALMFLDKAGILKGASDYFWAGVLAIGAAIFLVWFFSDRSKWWAAIPGFALAGMSASALLLDRLGWGGLAFLGGLGIGFFAVYFSRRDMWWAIIPGGVLITLGVSSALTEAFNIGDTGGVFMVGLGITFLLVALLARMNWAYIPAAALLVIGFFLGTPFTGVLSYVWIGVLLLGGVALIFGAVRK